MVGCNVIIHDGRIGVVIEERVDDCFRLFDVEINGEEETFYASEIDSFDHA